MSARTEQSRRQGARFGAGVAALATLVCTGTARGQSVPTDGGDDLEIGVTPTAPPTAAPTAPPPAPAATADEVRALREALARLEAHVHQLESAPAVPPPPAAPPPPPAAPAPTPQGGDEITLRIGGYLQAEYQNSELSQDQLAPGGATLNRDRFLIRRGRIRAEADFRFASALIELDANTVRGPFVGVRRAEASLISPRGTNGLPYAVLTVGLMDIPFGFELAESARRRVFMERTLGSQAFFRGEPDVGIRVAGAVGFVRYALAAMNGSPVSDSPGGPPYAATAAKDFLGRVGVDTEPTRDVHFAAGVSFLAGRGFHAGTEATQNRVIWRDNNENGAVDSGEIMAVPGMAATPSATFAHWAVNADVQLAVRTSIGLTRVYAEATMASNLDRGFLVADPVVNGTDTRELSAYVAVVQDVTRYGLVGFRYDYYNGNLDALDSRRGALVPVNQSVHTLSPVVGLTLPDRARLVLQYDVVLDSLGRDARGVPADLRNNLFTARVQMEF